MEVIRLLNFILSVIFTICYAYQYIYIAIPFFVREKPTVRPVIPHRYAVLISARNEQLVIAQLIDSIKAQNYPGELVTIFVVADNCTDRTAEIAQQAGAIVFERFNTQQIGKGYALEYLFDQIRENYESDLFDAYLVFDADNLLDENYLAEMNKTFSQGHKIITSYRNSKNYGKNWITAGYSLWFLRESKYLNNARFLLGTSCAVSGTGFLLSREILERNGGWKFFLLTEDIEFSVHSVLQGEKIVFCKNAVLYDEQPDTFRVSWKQRVRWAKGFFQVFRKYGGRLVATAITRPSFACYDLTMMIMPAIMLTVLGLLLNLSGIIIGLIADATVGVVLLSILETFLNAYLLLFVMGLITTITEWRQIYCSAPRKLLFTLTFPLFMFTYIPIGLFALVSRVEWTPVHHSHCRTLNEVRSEARSA